MTNYEEWLAWQKKVIQEEIRQDLAEKDTGRNTGWGSVTDRDGSSK